MDTEMAIWSYHMDHVFNQARESQHYPVTKTVAHPHSNQVTAFRLDKE